MLTDGVESFFNCLKESANDLVFYEKYTYILEKISESARFLIASSEYCMLDPNVVGANTHFDISSILPTMYIV